MLQIEIPGHDSLLIQHLLLDFNGTIAFDGKLIDGVKEALACLTKDIDIHVVTADTFGDASEQLEDLPVKLTILPDIGQDEAKQGYLNTLGNEMTIAIGNGRNDCLMLQDAAIGIVLIQGEGAAQVTVQAADIVCTSIVNALRLLLNPKRLIATLRC